jgi:hypothetical protein
VDRDRTDHEIGRVPDIGHGSEEYRPDADRH